MLVKSVILSGNFIQSPKAEMFRKSIRNGASAENVLTKRLSESSVFYVVRSSKTSLLSGVFLASYLCLLNLSLSSYQVLPILISPCFLNLAA